jgi:hypothetical protein
VLEQAAEALYEVLGRGLSFLDFSREIRGVDDLTDRAAYLYAASSRLADEAQLVPQALGGDFSLQFAR